MLKAVQLFINRKSRYSDKKGVTLINIVGDFIVMTHKKLKARKNKKLQFQRNCTKNTFIHLNMMRIYDIRMYDVSEKDDSEVHEYPATKQVTREKKPMTVKKNL